MANALGMSKSARTLWHYNSNARRFVAFLKLPEPGPSEGTSGESVLSISFQLTLSVCSWQVTGVDSRWFSEASTRR